jgi:hypothetical protein
MISNLVLLLHFISLEKTIANKEEFIEPTIDILSENRED